MVVRPLAAWSSAACTTFSEVESRAEVACGRCDQGPHTGRTITKTSVPHPKAEPWDCEAEHERWRYVLGTEIVNKWFKLQLYSKHSRFWPPESCEPFPPTSVSKPLRIRQFWTSRRTSKNPYWGKVLMKSKILASRHAASISSWVTSFSGLIAPRRILNRIVPA